VRLFDQCCADSNPKRIPDAVGTPYFAVQLSAQAGRPEARFWPKTGLRRLRGENFARAPVQAGVSQHWRGETAEKKSANQALPGAETRDHTAPNSETPWKSRKIESLPRAGQLQVASK
jgi:hypothetical protein